MMTFEQKQAEAADRVAALALPILAALGGEFRRAEDIYGDPTFEHVCNVERRFRFVLQKGRLFITANFGRKLRTWAPGHPQITVGPERDPKAIAAEMQRRLLPDAVQAWETAEVCRHAEALCDDETFETRRRLQPFLSTGTQPGFYGGIFLLSSSAQYGHANIEGSTVTLELRSLNRQAAYAVLQALKGVPE